MSKTKIDWADYSINPVKGLCPMACPYCYARRMYKRFHWNETIRYDDWVWQEGSPMPAGSKIFVGSTMELFGRWVQKEWLRTIFEYCDSMHSRTFIFLTKQPWNLVEWSPFPENCWVGASATNWGMTNVALTFMRNVQAKVKFLSFEPLLENVVTPTYASFAGSLRGAGISWVIIGQQTPVRESTQPKLEWVKAIVDGADYEAVPVFEKDNLLSVMGSHLRQEFPKVLAKCG